MKQGYGSRDNARSSFFEIALLPWLVSGCSRAPSFDIVGSFFPAWLVCLVIGILLAPLARWLLLRHQIAVVWPILIYPSLVALFTFLFWLIFFS
jgi:fructose-specific phosphotransferase system IIC component